MPESFPAICEVQGRRLNATTTQVLITMDNFTLLSLLAMVAEGASVPVERLLPPDPKPGDIALMAQCRPPVVDAFHQLIQFVKA